MRSVLMGVAITMAAAVAGLDAQKITPLATGQGGSPHVRAEWTIDGANISIEYGRPFLRGRTLHEGGLVPYGQVWRTGADGATTLKTDKMLMFGSLHLNPGSYTLWTLPTAQGWQFIVNKQTGQWGTAYAADQDLGRVPMTVGKTTSPVESLTISIDDTAAGGVLRIEWGTTSVTVPFTTM